MKILSKIYIGDTLIVIYSSEVINKIISQLTDRHEKILEQRYGFISGNIKTGRKVANEIGLSNNRTAVIINDAIREIWLRQRKMRIFYNANAFLQADEIREDFINTLLNTGALFYQGEESENIDFETLRSRLDLYETRLKQLSDRDERKKYNSNEEDKKQEEIDESTPNEEEKPQGIEETQIAKLGFSHKTYNALARSGINTIGELIDRTDEDITKIRRVGVKSHDEIVGKLKELGLSLKQEETNQTSKQEKQAEIKKFIENAKRLAKLDQKLIKAREKNDQLEIEILTQERERVGKEIEDYLSK